MLDFSSFNCDDPTGWIYKINQFFHFYNILPHQRLRLASFHMEEKALIWFKDMKKSGQIQDWENFTRALLVRFGLNDYDDPIEALTKLR